MYAANRAFETSVVGRTRVQPSWFDTHHKFGFGAGYRSIPSANVKARLEWTANVTSKQLDEQFKNEEIVVTTHRNSFWSQEIAGGRT